MLLMQNVVLKCNRSCYLSNFGQENPPGLVPSHTMSPARRGCWSPGRLRPAALGRALGSGDAELRSAGAASWSHPRGLVLVALERPWLLVWMQRVPSPAVQPRAPQPRWLWQLPALGSGGTGVLAGPGR